MKNKINLLFLLCLMILACEKDSTDSIIKNFTCSGCKNNLKDSNESESLHLKMLNGNLLQIDHYNVYFNCKPGKILVKGEIVDGNHLKIYEDEEQHIADCICPYDLNYKISGLSNGESTITFFKGGRESLVYNIFLTSQIDTLINANPN